MTMRTLTVDGPDGTTALSRRQAVQADRAARLERMLEARHVETWIRRFHDDGVAWGSTHTAEWQEAAAVGLASALRADDLVCFPHRVHTLSLAFGITPEAVLAECLGRASGIVGGIGGSVHVTDTTVGILHTFTILGAQVPVAAGVGLALQVQGSPSVAVSIFGDGSVNMGAFHEGLNLAAVWRLPVLFVCENNQYSEHQRYDSITAGGEIAARAAAYAMPSHTVDGQDVDEVAAAVSAARARVAGGEGPFLLELQTWRRYGHSRSDQATYREEAEIASWLERDPIELFAGRLRSEGVLDEQAEAQMRARVAERVAGAAELALAAPEPDPSVMFKNVLAAGTEEG